MDRNNRFSMTLDILAAQFPRRSLIVCIPAAGISNFHGGVGAKNRIVRARCGADLRFPFDTMRYERSFTRVGENHIIILYLRRISVAKTAS